MASGTGFRWIVKEAYPIYAATGLASFMFAGFLAKVVITDPDLKVHKGRRTDAIPDETAEVAEGHFNHWIRRASHNSSSHIFPNEMMTKPNTS